MKQAFKNNNVKNYIHFDSKFTVNNPITSQGSYPIDNGEILGREVKADDLVSWCTKFDSEEGQTLFSVCLMDVVGYPCKQVGEDAYYEVIIKAPMICLTLIILHSLMVGRETCIKK